MNLNNDDLFMNVDLFDIVSDTIVKGNFDLMVLVQLTIIFVILQSLKCQKLYFMIIKMA